MISEDSFHYALENTHVIVAPQRTIETFGNTSFRFYLITELMDRTNQVRVRDGKVHAERPQILSPAHYSHLLLEGFGEKAREFADWMEHRSEQFAIFKYGFHFRKTDVVEELFDSPFDSVLARVREKVDRSEEPLSAVIQGVDDAWEVCLLKFTVDLIQQSAGGNLKDFKRRGLI
jgi:hypothetical protein